jgi:hypothetical protein
MHPSVEKVVGRFLPPAVEQVSPVSQRLHSDADFTSAETEAKQQ